MNLREIEFLLREGVHSLANHLETYWPAEWSETDGGYEPRETNLVLQVAMAFRRAGLLTYAEVPFGQRENGTAPRFDLLAISLTDHTRIVLEAKVGVRGTVEGFGNLKSDLWRITDHWTEIPGLEDHSNGPAYGILVATTWHEDVAQWWACDDAARESASRRAEFAGLDRSWKQGALKPKNTTEWNDPKGSVSNSFAFSAYNADEDGRYPWAYCIYTIFPLS